MARLAPEEKERRAAKRRRTEALQAEADVLRREQRQLEWAAEGAHLTRAELEAGVDCRGCGLPILDDLGPWPPLLRMGDSEREEYAAAQDTFRRRHLDCRSHGWSMNGSRTAHCGFCCPPPPLSDQQISEIAALFAQTTSPDPVDLDTWQLALT